jgi:hypothetical protein
MGAHIAVKGRAEISSLPLNEASAARVSQSQQSAFGGRDIIVPQDIRDRPPQQHDQTACLWFLSPRVRMITIFDSGAAYVAPAPGESVSFPKCNS